MARLKRAAVLLRPGDHYKSGVFADGLRRHGFEIVDRFDREPQPTDAILLWNRTRAYEAMAEIYERRGARVLITENGYTARPERGKFYALALDKHNGAGRWFVGDRIRHPISEGPWRLGGGHVLLLPQRGIGSQGVAMPSAWQRGVMDRLQRITDRPIVVRLHPGLRRNDARALEEDLEGAHCAVTWGSGAGVKALQAGVPVFHELAEWIAAPAARPLDRNLEDCHRSDRRIAWTRISWAQWTLEEIGSGEAFDALLNAPRGDLFCAREQSLGDRRPGDGRRREPERSDRGVALVD